MKGLGGIIAKIALTGAMVLYLGDVAAATAAPFDEGAARLAPGFQGVDVDRLIAALKKRVAVKGKDEFETTAAYEDRKRAMESSSIIPGVSAASTVAFVAVAPVVTTTYDADKGALRIEWNPASTGVGDLERYGVTKTTTANDKYVASNAFNVKAVVSRVRTHETGVVYKTKMGYRQIVDEWIPMPPGRARALKSDPVRVLLVGRLDDDTEEPVIESADGSPPTITVPVDIGVSRALARMKLQRVWIFDQRSGEVLAKIRPCLEYPCEPESTDANKPSN